MPKQNNLMIELVMKLIKTPLRNIIGSFLSILIFCSCVLTGCLNEHQYLRADEVTKLKLVYLPEFFNPIAAIENCDKIFAYTYPIRKDTLINDHDVITELVEIINNFNLNDDNSLRYDFRIKCFIYCSNGEIKNLCIDRNNQIIFDGIAMKESKNMSELISSMLY